MTDRIKHVFYKLDFKYIIFAYLLPILTLKECILWIKRHSCTHSLGKYRKNTKSCSWKYHKKLKITAINAAYFHWILIIRALFTLLLEYSELLLISWEQFSFFTYLHDSNYSRYIFRVLKHLRPEYIILLIHGVEKIC